MSPVILSTQRRGHQATRVRRLRPFALTVCGLLFAAKIASGGACDLQVTGNGKDASGDWYIQLSASVRLQSTYNGGGHWNISQTSGPVGTRGVGCDGPIDGGTGAASGTCSWTFLASPAQGTFTVSFRLSASGGGQYQAGDTCESATLPIQLGAEGPGPGPTPTGSGAIQYHHVDALGSLRVVTDDTTHVVVSRTDYLPFGEMIAPNVPSPDFRLPHLQYGGEDSVHHRFTGQFHDEESQLDYFGARYFSSQQGRFMSPDDVRNDEDIADPQSWNRYAYGRNNPLRFVDPNGKAVVETKKMPQAYFAFNQSVREGIDAVLSFDPFPQDQALGAIAKGFLPVNQKESDALQASTLAAPMVVPLEAPAAAALQAGEAGAFSALENRAVVGDLITPHHMPQAALKFTSRAEGGALAVAQEEHVLTRTYGAAGRATAQGEAGLSFRDVLARDIRDIRQIVGTKYNQGVRQLLDYYEKKFPQLLAKQPPK